MRFSVLGFRSDLRIELQAPVMGRKESNQNKQLSRVMILALCARTDNAYSS